MDRIGYEERKNLMFINFILIIAIIPLSSVTGLFSTRTILSIYSFVCSLIRFSIQFLPSFEIKPSTFVTFLTHSICYYHISIALSSYVILIFEYAEPAVPSDCFRFL